MTYAEKKLHDAINFYKKVMEDANLYIPTDGWLSMERASEANKAWQTMMHSIHVMLCQMALEKQEQSIATRKLPGSKYNSGRKGRKAS